ncbi:hypothetical protein B0H15DRAFT_832141 [Mycena belliarum]|uniref:Uncharacterized protein n=1 Tax=Mycena belliarum TaxID=1033014 RepID=A0AAD6XT39_9AGAR|nr:hypothetical protein B0H15DRAFT_832141 [Mycena belliae]
MRTLNIQRRTRPRRLPMSHLRSPCYLLAMHLWTPGGYGVSAHDPFGRSYADGVGVDLKQMETSVLLLSGRRLSGAALSSFDPKCAFPAIGGSRVVRVPVEDAMIVRAVLPRHVGRFRRPSHLPHPPGGCKRHGSAYRGPGLRRSAQDPGVLLPAYRPVPRLPPTVDLNRWPRHARLPRPSHVLKLPSRGGSGRARPVARPYIGHSDVLGGPRVLRELRTHGEKERPDDNSTDDSSFLPSSSGVFQERCRSCLRSTTLAYHDHDDVDARRRCISSFPVRRPALRGTACSGRRRRMSSEELGAHVSRRASAVGAMV